jgi:hypothetical protein
MNRTKEKTRPSEEHIPPYNGGNSRSWTLDGCPRCHGDVFLETEDGDLLAHCLQCGYVALGARETVTSTVNPFESDKG